MSHLQVVLRVPVRVKYDAGVSSCKVDTETASTGTKKEDEAVRVWLAEAIDGCLPQVPTHSAIYSLIKVSKGGKKLKTQKMWNKLKISQYCCQHFIFID